MTDDKKSRYDKLVDEALRNIREDRERLKRSVEDIEKAKMSQDPDIVYAYVKYLPNLTDSMIKVNMQIVDLIRTESRRTPSNVDKDNPLNDDEKEDMWEQIKEENN